MFRVKSPIPKINRKLIKLRKAIQLSNVLNESMVKNLRTPLKTVKINRRRLWNKNFSLLFDGSVHPSQKNAHKSRTSRVLPIKSWVKSDSTKESTDNEGEEGNGKCFQKIEETYWLSIHSMMLEVVKNKVEEAKRARFSPLTSPIRLMNKLNEVRMRKMRRFMSTSIEKPKGVLSPNFRKYSKANKNSRTKINDITLTNCRMVLSNEL